MTLWKRRLRELRDSLAACADAEAVEDAWTFWDAERTPPADAAARAKELVDDRLAALDYNRAKEGSA